MLFTTWLRTLRLAMTPNSATRTRNNAPRRPSFGFRPLLERLEDRTVPSAVEFSPAQTFASGGTGAFSVVTADFNSDGHADVAVANFSANNVGVLLGNGSGGFAAPVAFNSGGSGPISVSIGDFNNDGNSDLA